MVKLSMISAVKILTISSCFMVMFSSNVLANTQDYGIEVQGQASVMVEPDSFALSIAIIEKGRLTDKIRAIVDYKSDQVIDVAKQLGIKAQDINSASVSLRVIEEEQMPKVRSLEINENLANNQQSKVHVGVPSVNGEMTSADHVRPQYFELSRSITVKFSKINDYDQFLNKVIKIGVSQISPLTMSVDDTDKYYQQALTQAFKNAKEKALQIASQAEQSLGGLVYIKELSSNHYRAQYNSAMRSVSSSFGHNSQVGNQQIYASVLVKYSLE